MISINSSDTSSKVINLSQHDNEFIEMINNRITLYGELPYTIPKKLLIDVIKSSAKWFYKHYSNALYKSFFLINNTELKQFKGSFSERTIALRINPRIRVIMKVHDVDAPRYTLSDGLDSEIGGSYNSSMSFNLGGGARNYYGIDNHLYIIERTVKMAERAAFDAIYKTSIGFSYTPETGVLILKKMPSKSIIIECLVDSPIHTLYNNSLFERHVIANVKKELKRLIGGHTFELIGGTTINADEICNNIDDATEVEAAIKAGGGIGDIIVKR